jgi:hypothetical protein
MLNVELRPRVRSGLRNIDRKEHIDHREKRCIVKTKHLEVDLCDLCVLHGKKIKFQASCKGSPTLRVTPYSERAPLEVVGLLCGLILRLEPTEQRPFLRAERDVVLQVKGQAIILEAQ